MSFQIKKKSKNLDKPEKNGTAFKKVGQKRSKINLGGQFWESFQKKKIPLGNVPKVPCVKYESPRMNRKKRLLITTTHRQQTYGADDNTRNAKFAFRVKRPKAKKKLYRSSPPQVFFLDFCPNSHVI